MKYGLNTLLPGTLRSNLPSLGLSALLVVSASAQVEILPNAWVEDGSATPGLSSSLIIALGSGIDGSVSGSDTAGPWNLTARGRTQVRLPLVVNAYSRAITEVDADTQTLSFGLDNSIQILDLLGSPIADIDGLLGGGVDFGWDAKLSFPTLDLTDNTRFDFSFDVNMPAGLLSNIADVFEVFSFGLYDSEGNPLAVASGGTALTLLGINILGGDVNGNLSFELTGPAPVEPLTGIEFRVNASTFAGISLAGIGDEVLSISNISLTATPVPEPSALIAAVAGLGLCYRRRR